MRIRRLADFGALLGGLGLFLLAVGMISAGLRKAAGKQLRYMLERWTGTPARGVAAGALITALVQSSSAVTVATIGFVNAGILSLPHALGVVFGSNVGTTMTGWLVATVGFKLKLEAFALPLIGLGMLLRLTGPSERRGALGEAIAGFGLFFIGIDILQAAFAGLADSISLPQLSSINLSQMLWLVGLGFLMTVLTQSSSAAIAIILTAASGEALPMNGAAAMVIGANIGTTSTAALAVIGATANAKRVAAGHILFNGLTGIVALLMLPLLLWVIDATRDQLGLAAQPAVFLALFHTLFNLLGVALMWPAIGMLARFLGQRFRTVEEAEARPQYLDKTIVQNPALAGNAFAMELMRLLQIARRAARAVALITSASSRQTHRDLATAQLLTAQISHYVELLGRQDLSSEVSAQLSQVLRIARYLVAVAELAETVAALQPTRDPPGSLELVEAFERYRTHYYALLDATDLEQFISMQTAEDSLQALEMSYQALKATLLANGARQVIDLSTMTDYLEQLSRSRRMLQQLLKAVQLLHSMQNQLKIDASGSEPAVSQVT